MDMPRTTAANKRLRAGTVAWIAVGVCLGVVVLPTLLLVADVYLELYGDRSRRATVRRQLTTRRLSLLCKLAVPQVPRISEWIAKDNMGRFAIVFQWLQHMCDYVLVLLPQWEKQSGGMVSTLRLGLVAHGIV